MRILWFSDTHLHPTHRFSHPTRDALSVRLLESIDCHRWVGSQIRTHKPDLVVCGGDIVHSQGQVSVDTLHAVALAMNEVNVACHEVGAPLWVLVGNHDKESDDSRMVYASKFLMGWSGVRIFDRPTLADGIAVIPHLKADEAALKSFAATENLFQADLALTHLDIAEARFHAKLADEHGLPRSIFANFKTVVNGHYHMPQVLGNIYMPGSPQTFSFREPQSDIQKGIALIDDGVVSFIQNNHSPQWLTFTEDNLDELMGREGKRDYASISVLNTGSLEDVGATPEYLRNSFLNHEVIQEVERISARKTLSEGTEHKSDEELLSDFVMAVEPDALRARTLVDYGINKIQVCR